MNNTNVYVRGNKTIRTISLTKILFLLPLIIYGYYKNGISIYLENHMLLYLVRPLFILFGSISIGILVNIFYEMFIKHHKKKIIDMIFSSFHVEYAIILSSLTFPTINLIVYFTTIFIIFLLSKFIKNRINIISLIFIIIYAICTYYYSFEYPSISLDKLNILDYLFGNIPGGLFATNIIFIIIAYIGLTITHNIKSNITLYAILSYGLLAIVYSLITETNILELLFLNNYIYIFTFVITDSVTSCYTNKGTKVFGLLVGIMTFAIYFINPILAPFISVLIISLFNNLIDRKINILKNKSN